MGFIPTLMTNSKELAAVATELQAIRERLDKISATIDSKSIKSEALLSMILEKESVTQDKYDELMSTLRSFGKQKGFKL
jgi:hypothetical protein